MGTQVLVFLVGTLAVLLTLLGVYGGGMDAKMLVFTPVVSLATGVFALALYRNVARKLQGPWRQWHGLWTMRDLDLGALVAGFVSDVLFQRKLYRSDRIRWARHILIYWGFVGLWGLDAIFFLSTKILHLPAPHPFRLLLDFGLDLYGSLLVLGLAAALVRASLLRGRHDSIYNNTPAAALFFVVAVTGFLLEAMRLAVVPYEPYMAWSFAGLALAHLLRGLGAPLASLYRGVWIFHALAASASIAYIPLGRMVHVFAVPLGRLLESQQAVLAAKIQALGRGLMGP